MSTTRRAGRTVLVGDVHGCADELELLLAQLDFRAGTDRLVLVGDLVVRGPDSAAVVRTARRLGARAVRGNHEEHLLDARRRRLADDDADVHPLHEAPLARLADDDWDYLEALPYWLDLPAHGALVVHAGVIPGRHPEEMDPGDLVSMRSLTPDGRPSPRRRDGELWGPRYEGPPHVVFGHDALGGLQLHAWATGLDTGCVYGGRLTALVLEAGDPVPPSPAERSVHSVVAARPYFDP